MQHNATWENESFQTYTPLELFTRNKVQPRGFLKSLKSLAGEMKCSFSINNGEFSNLGYVFPQTEGCTDSMKVNGKDQGDL